MCSPPAEEEKYGGVDRDEESGQKRGRMRERKR
jgi:hypothetical protein